MQKIESKLLDEKGGVAAAYEVGQVAKTYLDMRLKFAWQRLMHRRQVQILNAAYLRNRPASVLEIAPGPARLSTELKDVRNGVMIENSSEMLSIARSRLQALGLSAGWDVRQGDAFKLQELVAAGSFEFAYTFRFLRHFRTPEREQLYAALRASLASGGWLMFDVVGSEMTDRVNRENPRAEGEIPIYDVTYTADSFRAEMKKNGFEVVELTPVLQQFPLQATASYKLEGLASPLADAIVRGLEVIPSNSPLEWVALCRKA